MSERPLQAFESPHDNTSESAYFSVLAISPRPVRSMHTPVKGPLASISPSTPLNTPRNILGTACLLLSQLRELDTTHIAHAQTSHEQARTCQRALEALISALGAEISPSSADSGGGNKTSVALAPATSATLSAPWHVFRFGRESSDQNLHQHVCPCPCPTNTPSSVKLSPAASCSLVQFAMQSPRLRGLFDLRGPGWVNHNAWQTTADYSPEKACLVGANTSGCVAASSDSSIHPDLGGDDSRTGDDSESLHCHSQPPECETRKGKTSFREPVSHAGDLVPVPLELKRGPQAKGFSATKAFVAKFRRQYPSSRTQDHGISNGVEPLPGVATVYYQGSQRHSPSHGKTRTQAKVSWSSSSKQYPGERTPSSNIQSSQDNPMETNPEAWPRTVMRRGSWKRCIIRENAMRARESAAKKPSV